MIVEVTQENINQGVSNGNSCPVALAMQDKGFKNVQVTDWCIFCDQQPTPLQLYTRVCIKVDSPVTQWINDFDGGENVSPIQIEINEEGRNATLVE